MRRVLGNPSLRRVELAFLGFVGAEMGVWVAVLVYAYRHGGTAMAAVIAAIQLVPAAVLAPAAVEVADRRGQAVTLAASYAIQAGALLGTGAAFLLGAPSLIGYACATVAACAVTLTRPAQSALVPQLVRTPSELTAANVTSGWVESASMLMGPAVAGVLISLDGPGLAVAGFGVVLVACALAAEGLEHSAGRSGALVERHDAVPDAPDRQGLLALCLRERAVSALLGLFFVQFVAFGSLDVLVVVLAIQQLHLGSSGAGYLESMFGLGTVLGAFAAVGLVGRRRLSAPVLIAAVTWGASLLLMAGLATAAAVFGLLVVIGASRTVFDVGGRTLLHRAVSPRVHVRMFGVLEGLEMAGLAVGSLTVPVLVSVGGISAALIGVGIALIGFSGAALAALGRLPDGLAVSEQLLGLVRASPLFAMLGPPVLEDIVRGLVALELTDGEVAVREGEAGDRYYIVGEGELEVTIGGEEIRTLHSADGFGEIALLRDGIRTATVAARGPATLYALQRPAFLQALGASRQARRAAESLVSERVGSAPAG